MKRRMCSSTRLWSAVLPVCLIAALSASAQESAVMESVDAAAAKAEAAVAPAGEAAAEATAGLGAIGEMAADKAAAGVDAAGEAAEGAMTAVEGAASEAAEGAMSAVEGAASEAAEGAMSAVEGAASEAAEVAAEAGEAAEAAAGDAMTAAEEAVTVEAEEMVPAIEEDATMPEEVAAEETAPSAGEGEEGDELVLPPTPGGEMAPAEEAPAEEAPAEETSVEAPAEPVVLVEVNGVKFTSEEADKEVEKRLSMFGGQVPPAQLESIRGRMREQIVDDFVNRTLLQAELEKSGITTEETEIDEFIETARQGLPEGFTLEQFLEQRGLSVDEMRRDVQFQLGAKKLLDQKLGDKLEVSEEEIQEFFDREKERMGEPESVRARHILLSVDAEATDEARAEKRAMIEKIKEELDAGASFETVAAEKSDCPSKSRGGDLGTFVRGQMVGPFEEAAFSQEIGKVGDIVETRFGFHLIEVLEKNAAKEPDLEASREEIVEVLKNQRRGTLFQDYIQELRAQSNVVMPAQ